MPQTPAKHDPAPEQMAPVLRERIYGGITCLSTLLILVRHSASDSTPSASAVDVAVGGGALWAASVFADYVSHVVAHGRHPRGAEIAHGLWASGQILEAFAMPLLLLVLASLGLMPFRAALWAGIWITVVTLGLFALLAARRLPVPNWQRAVLVMVLLVLGALVVIIKTLAY
jgi:hypothetical protein